MFYKCVTIYTYSTQDHAHLQMHFCHHFPHQTPPILLKMLNYSASANKFDPIKKIILRSIWNRKSCRKIVGLKTCVCQFPTVSGWLFADGQWLGLSAGAEVSPGMPCMRLNLWMPPNLHLCGFKSAYQPWCQQVSSFGLKFNWQTCRRLSCHMQWMMFKSLRLRGGRLSLKCLTPCVHMYWLSKATLIFTDGLNPCGS